MHRRLLLLGSVAAVALLPLSACTSTANGTSSSTAKPNPVDVLAAAKQKFDTAKAVTITLTSTDVPPKANGVSAAQGTGIIDATTPRFKGQVTATVNGLTGNVPVITIGNDAYMKLFTPTYTKQDLAALGAPNPSGLFNPATGISSLLSQTK
ncbi:MAG: LppX_LprAFG lipoprotein, partial [Nostocoides sp.]